MQLKYDQATHSSNAEVEIEFMAYMLNIEMHPTWLNVDNSSDGNLLRILGSWGGMWCVYQIQNNQ